ncbi:MAG: hypothetical protein EU532_03790 [Promethearchaeota archaeon]|nr:MAG: hypothetical protein EU532_03790 [Candidatus Lokiarchaeota archaeon]
MELTEIDIISGIFSIISIIIFTIMGLIIVSKYFKHKTRDHLLFGITVVGLAEPLYGPAFSFLSVLFTGKSLSVEIYFLISLVGNPIILVCFITVVTDLFYKDKQKIIQLIFIIYSVIIEICLIYFLIYYPSLVGKLMGITDSEYGLFSRIYVISALLVLIIGGTLIARESLRSNNREIKLKGKILLPAFYLFAISAIIDAAVPLNAVTLLLNRILFILSGILFYVGFILPDWMKNLILKEK